MHRLLYNTSPMLNLVIFIIRTESVERDDCLGFVTDKSLKWNRHIFQPTQMIRKLFYKFEILKSFLYVDLLKTIYVALVQSKNCLWDSNLGTALMMLIFSFEYYYE